MESERSLVTAPTAGDQYRMNAATEQHLARPWRVHRVAADFALEDVWQFELGRPDGRGLDDFLDVVWNNFRELERSPLGRLRVWLGDRLGWDACPSLPIPGCEEHSVVARLTGAEIAASFASPADPSPVPAAGLTPIYRFADEALYEISNRTIHALLHVGWVAESSGDAGGALAVYVKHRGVASKLYMAAIWPARHAVIYPALVRGVERRWRAQRSDGADAAAQAHPGRREGLPPAEPGELR
jgi:hypothetical protein